MTTYDDGRGTRWDEIRPPAGWSPVRATDEELAAFGFGERPSAPELRADWERAFANYRGVAEPTPPRQRCGRGDMRFSTFYNDHWSGGVVNGNSDYRRTYATVRWPQFTQNCGPRGENVTGIWAGPGGFGSSHDLLQVGVYTRLDNDNGQAFWQAVNNGQSSPVYELTLPVSNQDLLRPDVYYNSSTGRVSFQVYNQTTGQTTPAAEPQSIMNYAPSSFYDGTSAEIIHERPLGGLFDGTPTGGGNVSGGKYGLRQWQATGAGVSSAVVVRAGQAANYYGNYPHDIINMTANGQPTPYSTLLAYMNGGYATSGSWSMSWNNCHG